MEKSLLSPSRAFAPPPPLLFFHLSSHVNRLKETGRAFVVFRTVSMHTLNNTVHANHWTEQTTKKKRKERGMGKKGMGKELKNWLPVQICGSLK